MTDVKICGITRLQDLQACLSLPVRYIGFNFVPTSKRLVTLADAARLSVQLPAGVRSIGLFADPADEDIHAVIPHMRLDMIQLHGGETPSRVAEIKAQTGLQVMKAIPVAGVGDLACVPDYEAVCDWLLFDAKNEHGQSGGLGRVFDWSVLSAVALNRPWMLAGGLTADNVGDAVRRLSPDAVDVAGGVETPPGEKDACKIRQFVEAVRS